MPTETEQFASAFDCLGRKVLSELAPLPLSLLHQPLECLEGDSLFRRAVRVIEESQQWALEVVSEHRVRHHLAAEISPQETSDDLRLRYRRWHQNLHQILEATPSALLDCFVHPPNLTCDLFHEQPIMVRSCLLYALERSAMHAGRIQLVCQMIATKGLCQDGQQASQTQDISPYLLPEWIKGPLSETSFP